MLEHNTLLVMVQCKCVLHYTLNKHISSWPNTHNKYKSR